MSQKFVMLFLVSKTQTVTLDTAAKILIEEGQDESCHSKYKSKTILMLKIICIPLLIKCSSQSFLCLFS